MEQAVIAPAPRRPLESRPSPTFSVVISAYQAASTVRDAAASALAQTRLPHEVIVVDDGSTDDVAGALSGFSDQITLIRKENGGGASALNAGVAAASGEFLAILDADDVYKPRRLEVLGDLAASRPDLDILTTESSVVVDGRVVGRFHAMNPFVADDQRTAILGSCFVGGWPAVRISRLLAIDGFDETLRIAYDWDCWIRLILDGALAGFVDEPHLEYRLRPGSLTTNRVRSLWERARILEKASSNPSLRPEERPALARFLLYHRTRAVLADAEAALARGEVARARFLRQAVSRHVTKRARLLLAVTAAAPRLGRKWLPRDPGPGGHRLGVSA
jgi:glycosyltransferase involved in cell wall biosynthesis